MEPLATRLVAAGADGDAVHLVRDQISLSGYRHSLLHHALKRLLRRHGVVKVGALLFRKLPLHRDEELALLLQVLDIPDKRLEVDVRPEVLHRAVALAVLA